MTARAYPRRSERPEGAADYAVFQNITEEAERELLDKVRAYRRQRYDAGYGAGPAVFGPICVRTGYPPAFALTGALILAAVPAAVRERKTPAGGAPPM